MPGLLKTVPVTDEQRRAHDRHRPLIVVAVLAVLCLYVYSFTRVHRDLGLPAPQDLVERLGISPRYVFDPVYRTVEWQEPITIQRFNPDGRPADAEWGEYVWRERLEPGEGQFLKFYLVAIAAFLCAYFLPLRFKQPSLVVWSSVAVGLLYGARGLAALLLAHSLVYLILHPTRSRLLAALPGILGWLAFGHLIPVPAWRVSFLLLLPAAWALLYRLVLLRLLDLRRFASVARTVVIHSALLSVCAGALREGIGGEEWVLPLGLLLFFWQWQRLILYHVDYKDGRVPRDISPMRYLAVFFTPGAVAYWDWGAEIAQGYAYTHDNFLCRDKNELAIGGLRLLLVAFGYFVFWDWLRYALVDFFDLLGVPVHNAETQQMVRHFMRGGDVSPASVLLTTLLDLVRWLMVIGGMVHFKVGLWRICGHRVDPFFDRPWLATNLVTFWSRFTFHYREFLVRAFYYPVFFRFFRGHRLIRIVLATMVAATVANLVWGHLTEVMYDEGMLFENFGHVLVTWPYFFLLGAGISLTEIYLLRRKRRRKPWTRGPRIVGDVLAAYCTLQFYALIHIFARPTADSTARDLFRLFLRAFGLDL